MPPNKGIFGRKGLKSDPKREGEAEGSGLLGEIAAGFYGGDPALDSPALLALPAGPPPTGQDDYEAYDEVDDEDYGYEEEEDSFSVQPVSKVRVAPQPLPDLPGLSEDPFEDEDEAGYDDEADALDVAIPASPRLRSEPIAAEPVNITLEMQFEAAAEPEPEPWNPPATEFVAAAPAPKLFDRSFSEPTFSEPQFQSSYQPTPLHHNEEEAPMKSDRTPLVGEHIERLRRGLELVITEDQVMSLSGRAIGQLVPQLSTELLLTTDGQALSHVLATGPNGEGPGCTVSDTNACPAMRLQRMLVFENSEYLDACPYLVIRRGEPCGAVCIPFKMPDEVGGVLHATSPATKPIDEKTIDDMAVTVTLISRRSFEIRSGERLDHEGVEAEVSRLLSERFGGENGPAIPSGDLPTYVETPTYAQESYVTYAPDSGAANWGSDAGFGASTAEVTASGPEVIEGIVEELVSDGVTLALGLVHLDKFRIYNRTHGLEIGDAAVQRFRDVAEVIIRPGDVLANDGGDEFFFVFPETTAKEAAAICDRIRTELADSFVDDTLPPFTASIGIADTDDGTSFDELLEAVERAVVSAEAAGRDVVMTSRASGVSKLSKAKK